MPLDPTVPLDSVSYSPSHSPMSASPSPSSGECLGIRWQIYCTHWFPHTICIAAPLQPAQFQLEVQISISRGCLPFGLFKHNPTRHTPSALSFPPATLMTKHAPPGVQFHFGRLLVTLRMMVACFEAVTSRLCEKMTFLTPKVIVLYQFPGNQNARSCQSPFSFPLATSPDCFPPHEC